MIVDIALPIPVGKYFSYTVPDILPHTFRCGQGCVSRSVKGMRPVSSPGSVTATATGLKSIIEPLEFFPLVDAELASLADWASSFYLTPAGLVMKYALPPLRDIERYLVVEPAGEDPSTIDSVPLNKMIKKIRAAEAHGAFQE